MTVQKFLRRACRSVPGPLIPDMLQHRFRKISIRVQAAAYRILARLGIHLHPRDRMLTRRFHEMRNQLEQLKAMLGEDAHVGFISKEKTRVTGEDRWRDRENPAVPMDRWAIYCTLLEAVGASAVSHVGTTVTLRLSTRGLSCKGFVWSPAHRVLVPSLEAYPIPPEEHAHILLDDQWHIFYGWDS